MAKCSKNLWSRDRRREGSACYSVPDLEVPRYQRVQGTFVKVKHLARLVDEHAALQRGGVIWIVAECVVPEVIDYFERQEEAGCVDVYVPVEYGAVDDLNTGEVVESLLLL